MKCDLPRYLTTSLAALAATGLLSSCFSNQPVYSGFASKLGDPLSALEEEPPPTPPNMLMDPIQERYGAFSVRFIEDLTASSDNHEVDPDLKGTRKDLRSPLR
ncbi:MAG: hypothetical protein KDN20_01390 [Verrucomicrobiae bacterium]|nr:hypothetical protein [Verrucomicrobiae bacterium]